MCAGGGGLLSGASAQDKNLAFSKVVRKAYRTVFKRVIRPLLNRNFSNQLPLCTSNHCIVLPGQPPPASHTMPVSGHVSWPPLQQAGCRAWPGHSAHASGEQQSSCPVMHAGPGKQGDDGCAWTCALSPKPGACHAVGMEDMNQFSATTPPDSKDPNAPWYHMNVNGTGEQPAAIWHPLHDTISTAAHLWAQKFSSGRYLPLAELGRYKALTSVLHAARLP